MWASFSGFQNIINFDFSPKIDHDVAKHKKSGVGSGLIFETITGKLLTAFQIKGFWQNWG